MGSGDLTASTPVFVDANDGVLIKSTIDDLNLNVVTDILIFERVGGQHKFVIFKVQREA
ncbi:hypothetical protein LCGC14_1802670 [marine sediment metagenome]|uniref:Uncharacterized protein n=1 Tax=marine sediment metagenome TaxID=412755 RepID=A0A0F9J3S7_9ZZZZ